MGIEVLGTGCSGCKALYETTKHAVAELGIDAAVVKQEGIVKIMFYNVMPLPGLVIDGKVVSKGEKLLLAEVKRIIT